jgi:hypothetical protein
VLRPHHTPDSSVNQRRSPDSRRPHQAYACGASPGPGQIRSSCSMASASSSRTARRGPTAAPRSSSLRPRRRPAGRGLGIQVRPQPDQLGPMPAPSRAAPGWPAGRSRPRAAGFPCCWRAVRGSERRRQAGEWCTLARWSEPLTWPRDRPSKLATRVRFPSPAPLTTFMNTCGQLIF